MSGLLPRAGFRLCLSAALAGLVSISVLAMPAGAQDRYGARPPVVLSPDLSAPWVMQLHRSGPVTREAAYRRSPLDRDAATRQAAPQERRSTLFGGRAERRPAQVAAAPGRAERPMMPQMDPIFLPQQVAYSGGQKPGTIVVDSASKFLYLVQPGGTARRYGVGVGKEGFGWKGTQTVSRKAEWPGWTPPAQMIARERAKGRILPAHMPGGPDNPLGARALYLGSTLYRIHGTNQPWTIGQNVSSGCIRMRNEDVMDLYERVKVGARVVVI